MYGREIEGEVHTFGVSGKLIMNVLVMYDRETRTLWSQFLHRGVKGPLTGTDLELVPATQTTWGLWHGLHPDTLVLNKRGGYRSDSYSSYYRNGRAGVLGESTADGRLHRKELVLGLGVDGAAKAYPLAALEDQPVVNDRVGDRDIMVFMDTDADTALAFSRMVDGRTLTFRAGGGVSGPHATLVDNETGSRWVALTGAAIEGELAGSTLERVPTHLSFWFAWKDWNPRTEVFGG